MTDFDDSMDSLHADLVGRGVDEAALERQKSKEKAYRELHELAEQGAKTIQGDLVTFVMISAASGVIGNISYDMIKTAFQRAVRTRTARPSSKVMEEIAIEAVRAHCTQQGWGIPPAGDFHAQVRLQADANYEDGCTVDVRNRGLHATVIIPWPNKAKKRHATVTIQSMPYDLLPHKIQKQFSSNMRIFGVEGIEQDYDINVEFLSEGTVLELALHLAASGGLNEARALYEQVIDSGHPVFASMAGLRLGTLLESQGNIAGAQVAFERAMRSDDDETASRAALGLGLMFKDHDNAEAAQTAFRQAMNSKDIEVTSRAAYWLGALLADQGDIEGARASYQQAIDSGDAEILPRATYTLGVLFDTQHNAEKAKALYQAAINSGHPTFAAAGACSLGVLLEKQGDVEGAQAAYQKAIESGHAEIALMCGIMLRDLLDKRGD